MLYLSRFTQGWLGVDKRYWVVDTDDYIESELTRKELENAIFRHGLHIEGITVGGTKHILATPYQDEMYLTPLQAKVKTMLGIAIHRFSDEITYIGAVSGVKLNNTSIRLSTYGRKMWWTSPIRWASQAADKELVLVVDDNIDMLGQFCGDYQPGVLFDIRQVKNDSVIGNIYGGLMRHATPYTWENHLIDLPDRLGFWKECAGVMR